MGFITTLLAGPAAGLFGSLISGVFGYFEKKEQRKADLEKYEHELNLTRANLEFQGQELENEALIAQVKSTADMLKGSYRHDASYGQASPMIVNVLRIIRPALTLFLLVLVTLIYFSVAEGATIEIGDQGLTIRERIVMSVIFMSEASLTWWFADRRRSNK